MNCSELIFSTKTANYDQVRNHLEACDLLVTPPLHTIVDIPTYARKIAERSITFEAWFQGALVGLLAAYYNDKDSQRGFITFVGVTGDFQRFGVGSRLIESAIDYGVCAGFKTIRLETYSANKPAIGFYETHGFTVSKDEGKKLTLERSLALASFPNANDSGISS